MSHTILELLARNLHEVFGEGDAVRRRKVIEEIFHEDAVFYDPEGFYRGWDEIDQIAGTLRSAHRDFDYTETHASEDLHGAAGRVRWVSGRAGEDPSYAGTDIIVARDGRITAVYLFFDTPPA